MENLLVSYCLFVYNQEKYVRESLEGALAQSYSPLEIIVSDDCSNDNTVEVIQKVLADYKGPHDVRFNRNDKNIGLGGHFSKVVGQLARGSHVVTVGGDDISEPDHVEMAVRLIREQESTTLIDLSARTIDTKGEILSLSNGPRSFQRLTLEDYLVSARFPKTCAPARIFLKEFYDMFGEIHADCKTEDSVMVFRALLSGGYSRAPDIAIKYRRHQEALSSHGQWKRLSPRAIIEQYRRDAKIANERGLIDGRTAVVIGLRISMEALERYSRSRFRSKSLSYNLVRLVEKLLFLIYRTWAKISMRIYRKSIFL